MGKFLFSLASGKALGKLFSVGGALLAVQLLPLLLSWLPGVSISATNWNFNLLNPLENALQFAPAGFRYLIAYTYADLAVTLFVSGLVYGLAKDIIVGSK